jgi:hypothetical protein
VSGRRGVDLNCAMQFRAISRGITREIEYANAAVYSAAMDCVAGIIVDKIVALTGASSRKDYPEHLRRIRFKDPETGKALVFLASVPYQSIN